MFWSQIVSAQIEPEASKWKTWFISSGKDYCLPKPDFNENEFGQVMTAQQTLDSAGLQQILYWNAGAPGYRWQELMSKTWMTDTTYNGPLANMLLSIAIYDATIAAWETKYRYNKKRPFEAGAKIKALIPKPDSPSYPCEHSVAAGVASQIFRHFYPSLADSVDRMANRMMASRVAAGVAYPSDTRAGFDLGKRIAALEIERTKDFVPKTKWDGKIPDQIGIWTGTKPMAPLAGQSKTIVLKNSSQFRPGPPPDWTKEMEELKNFKQTFRSMSNAWFWASQNFWEDALNKKIFEYNLHLNPPRASRLYAITAIGMYEGFVATWDAKYTYWGIRPDQYDTTYQPLILFSPPFPGYPSGHAAISGVMAELYSFFFPTESAYFRKKAKDAAESRFQAGIHFRSDNEVGLEMGKKIGNAIINHVRNSEQGTNTDNLTGR